MTYSTVSILALILNIVINHEVFGRYGIRSGIREIGQRAVDRYRWFLVASNCYFIADIAWGLLYERHDVPGLFPVLYIDCVLYFLFMFMTMLTWMRYVVAYLNKTGNRSKALLYVVWIMFSLAIVYLVINYFYPFIFSFNDRHEYVIEPGRHIAFILQIALYMVTSTYMLIIAHRSTGAKRVRYYAVGLTCLVMELFLIFQIFDPRYPSYAMGLVIGICVIHIFVEVDEKKEKEIYDNIASGLAEDYEAMYYINIETGEYREYARSKEYEALKVPVIGRDFYSETQGNIDTYVHPDDREFAHSLYYKETMKKNLEGRNSYSYKYRIMIGGQPKYYRFTVRRTNDGEHFVLYEKDIDDEITAETIRLENQKQSITFSQIAESLASNYDVIYYVDVEDSSFVSFESKNRYGILDMKKSGDDFFRESRKDIQMIVHKNDREMVQDFLDRDHMISVFKNSKERSLDYRAIAGRRTHYIRLTARITGDNMHFIIGMENIDAEVKREKQHLKALNTEKELARRDELTGVKNKTAYMELEKTVQSGIDSETGYPPFAIVVCDANDLKKVNDSEGHAAGDEYIKECAMMLCDVFDHSPVFRVGGDEFAVFLRGNDHSNREELMKRLRDRVRENLQSEQGPILASGMAEYDPETDSRVSEVFDRADARMYEDKQSIKNG